MMKKCKLTILKTTLQSCNDGLRPVIIKVERVEE